MTNSTPIANISVPAMPLLSLDTHSTFATISVWSSLLATGKKHPTAKFAQQKLSMCLFFIFQQFLRLAWHFMTFLTYLCQTDSCPFSQSLSVFQSFWNGAGTCSKSDGCYDWTEMICHASNLSQLPSKHADIEAISSNHWRAFRTGNLYAAGTFTKIKLSIPNNCIVSQCAKSVSVLSGTDWLRQTLTDRHFLDKVSTATIGVGNHNSFWNSKQRFQLPHATPQGKL